MKTLNNACDLVYNIKAGNVGMMLMWICLGASAPSVHADVFSAPGAPGTDAVEKSSVELKPEAKTEAVEEAQVDKALKDDSAKEVPTKKAPGMGVNNPVIKKYDLNQDGKLDEKELAAAKTALAAKRGEDREQKIERLKKMMARFDTNKDGKLDAEEKAAGERQLRAWFEQRPKALARADKDKDGKLSDAEWLEVREKWQKHMWELREGE